MYRPLILTLTGCLCLVASSLHSQPGATPGGTGPARPAVVEVHYVNGSIVYMTLLEEKIEVMTAFGKLTVPPDQIDGIEFGFHVEKEVETKVQALIQQLADNAYAKRELAVQELIQLGHRAHPALLENLKHTDPEVAKRVEHLLQVIEQKTPAKLLNRKSEDVIYTTKFTIVGKILNPSIRAKAEFFGDLNVLPSQLIAIGAPKTQAGPAQLTIDAAKYGSAHTQWMPTGIQIRSGQPLHITASGTVDLVPPQAGKYLCGPYGWQNGGKNNLNMEGTLQGRIGPNGPPFMIGEAYQGNADRDGELFLHIVPCVWNNPSTGTFQVKVTAGQK
jgi:hypothetical protein